MPARRSKKRSTPADFQPDPTPPPTVGQLAAREAVDRARNLPDDQLDEIVKLIAAGQTAFAIRDAIKTKFPDVDPNTGLEAGMLKLAEHIGLNAEVVKAWTLEAARAIYREAFAGGDYKSALAALKYCNDIATELSLLDKPDVPPAEQPA